MSVPRLGGQTGNLPLPNPGLVNNAQAFGSAPFVAGFQSGFTNVVNLAAGEVWMIPAGTWWITPGPYTFLQWLDPLTAGSSLTAGVSGQVSPSGVVGLWRTKPTAATRADYVISDGSNFRLANMTGCAIGAVITTGGATNPYTNGIGSTATGVTVTPSAGASKWVPVVGGAVSLTVSTLTGTTTAGTGYNFPPICVIDAPPAGGLQATAIVTSLSTGGIPAAAIQVLNQGAGYSVAPNLTFVPDPREVNASTPGPIANAVVVLTLTATGQLTGLYPYDHGSAQTSVPTLAITTATTTAQATVIMNFCVTTIGTFVTGGSSLGAVELVSVSNTIAASTNFLTNPLHNGVGVVFPRPARIMVGLTSGVASATTGTVFEDQGLGIQQVPSFGIIYTITSTTAVVPQPSLTPGVGGINDVSLIQAA